MGLGKLVRGRAHDECHALAHPPRAPNPRRE